MTDGSHLGGRVVIYKQKSPRFAARRSRRWPKLATDRLAGKLALHKDEVSSQVGGLHCPTQFLSKVWRNRMPVMQPLLAYYELAVRIEHHEVCVVSCGNSSLAEMT